MWDEKLSSDGRWAIQWATRKEFNSYFESDTTYEVLVINVASKKIVKLFIRSESANASGSENSGVREVSFAADSSAVIAEYEDGRTETIKLSA